MSRLSLIDLAGSEQATSQIERRSEGAFINKSLLTLEKVIASLTSEAKQKYVPFSFPTSFLPAIPPSPPCFSLLSPPSSSDLSTSYRPHVPYRDSKLTQILQPSLSGDARVAVIATMNPSPVAIAETISTLKFAQRVKRVVLKAVQHEVVDDKALLNKYRSHVRPSPMPVSSVLTTDGLTSCRSQCSKLNSSRLSPTTQLQAPLLRPISKPVKPRCACSLLPLIQQT
jgi:hypothetical protein